MFLAMEVLQNGSLYSMLHVQRRKFSQSEAVGILSDITSGKEQALVENKLLHESEYTCKKMLTVEPPIKDPPRKGHLS
jgi:hypothetical protein